MRAGTRTGDGPLGPSPQRQTIPRSQATQNRSTHPRARPQAHRPPSAPTDSHTPLTARRPPPTLVHQPFRPSSFAPLAPRPLRASTAPPPVAFSEPDLSPSTTCAPRPRSSRSPRLRWPRVRLRSALTTPTRTTRRVSGPVEWVGGRVMAGARSGLLARPRLGSLRARPRLTSRSTKQEC